jgi:antitoxin MazE
MQVQVIQIGNSRGVRLPKAVLEQLKFGETAELSVEQGRLVLAPQRAPREGWAESFKALAKATKKEDPALKAFRSVKNRFDETQWSW